MSAPDSHTAGIDYDRTKARWFGVQAEMPLDVPRSQIIRMLNCNVASDVISVRLHFHNLMKIWGAEATAVWSSVIPCLSQICLHATVPKIV